MTRSAPIMLAVAALVFGPLSVPARAQDGLGFSLASQVPTLCTLGGEVYQTSGNRATATPVSPGVSATARIDLNRSAAQEIGLVSATCNGGSATVTVASTNGFRLLNAGGGANREIPYSLSVAGTPLTAISTQGSYVESDVSGTARRSVTISVGTLNFLLLAAGQYTDTLTLSVTPNS